MGVSVAERPWRKQLGADCSGCAWPFVPQRETLGRGGPNFGPKHRGTWRNRRGEAANARTATPYFHSVSTLGAVRRH
jgi:hypothetical protein